MANDEGNDVLTNVAEKVGGTLGSIAGQVDALKEEHPHPVDEVREMVAAGGSRAASIGRRAKARVKAAVKTTRRAVGRASSRGSKVAKRARKGAGAAKKATRKAVSKARAGTKRTVARARKVRRRR